MTERTPEVRIHPTALIEDGVEIGTGSAIWDHAHIRGPARIGESCIVGGKSYIAYGVEIGDLVKINANAYICTAVTIERGVMIGAGTTFTNDRFPRAATPDLSALRSSEPDEHTLPTRVCEGASIGAGAVVGCDLTIGRFAMVGMGAVVTRSVGDFCLAFGNPARNRGIVCRCGEALLTFAPDQLPAEGELLCETCRRSYTLRDGKVHEQHRAPPIS